MTGKNYYLFNPGRMSRKDNTLVFVAKDENGIDQKAKYLPIEGIKSLYIFGSVDANSALYNFLGSQRVAVHFFDYYEHYTGSFQPKEYLLAGKMQIAQTKAYASNRKRIHIAKGFVDGACHNMLKNIKYYSNRKIEMQGLIDNIESYRVGLQGAEDIPTIMGYEGNSKHMYYEAFEYIIENFSMNNRAKRPPSNEVNALISFGNMMAYTLVLDQIYHTQLNPTISFLHEPGYRRYSLALDISEIFKPIIVDKLIFKLCNKRELRKEHFENKMGGCFLKDSGRKIFIRAFEDKLKETIKHRVLKKNVSYKQLVRLECYKLAKYILGIEKEYKPFKMWW